jgi:abequosyltransferase
MTGARSVSPSASPLLTIAIPTYNRAGYLAINLTQLHKEMESVAPGMVELIVSDNCSPDTTSEVVTQAIRTGLQVRYVRNQENVGWGRNFAQSFDLARGKYVLLLGDDDLLMDGVLARLVNHLAANEYGVVSLRAFGYDEDFRREYPGRFGGERTVRGGSEFLAVIGPMMTMTSCNVINKSLLVGVDSHQFSAGDLGALHLVLRAALAAKKNLYIDEYVIASKRQNSNSYEFSEVFVAEFWRIVDAHIPSGLTPQAIRIIETNMLFSYYPFYLLDLRLARRGNLELTHSQFADRFGNRWLFKYWLDPIIRLPRPLAIGWGSLTTFIGRAMGGELRRGISFARSRVARRLAGIVRRRPSRVK